MGELHLDIYMERIKREYMVDVVVRFHDIYIFIPFKPFHNSRVNLKSITVKPFAKHPSLTIYIRNKVVVLDSMLV